MIPKIVLITGASSGIGFDAAQALGRQGHKVYAAARRVALMEPLRTLGVVPIKMDVTDEASMQEGVRRVLEAEGRIDVLINNAGYGYFGAIETTPMEDARRQLEVNVFGLARLCQLVIPVMRSQGSGRIVNISSIAGRMVLQFGSWYSISKYSVEAFSDALRMEVNPFGIDVCIIEPGGIRTDWGLIAAQHLRENALGTAYESAALREADLLQFAYSGRWLSSPSIVTRAILRAVNRRHPRTRYRIGLGSRMMPFLHAILPSRWWDALIRRFLKIHFKNDIST